MMEESKDFDIWAHCQGDIDNTMRAIKAQLK
jgi:hypothetical protein